MLKGYKTKLAGAAAILSGLGMVLFGLVGEEGYQPEKVDAGWKMMLGGLTVFGLADKLERLLGSNK